VNPHANVEVRTAPETIGATFLTLSMIGRVDAAGLVRVGISGIGDEQDAHTPRTVGAANRAKGRDGDRAARAHTETVAVMRKERARSRAVGLALAAACVLATALPVPAQQPVRIVGVVQWVSSTSMAVMSDHGDSIMIDLKEADQSTYRGLRTGDSVIIDGTLAPNRRHVIARDIWHDDNRGARTQAP
jgi:hypothetical protein